MALVILADVCTGCGACASVCPEGAISRGIEALEIDPSLCTECEECQSVCPVDCIRHPNERL
ncbi:MAG TPA: 4Fe-4S binding protein [Crinalium sp.]|jgi:ferredoxin